MKRDLLIYLFLIFFVVSGFSANSKLVEYSANYKIAVTGATKKVQFTCLIPQDIQNIQRVISISYSRPPTKVYELNGSKYANFLIESEYGILPINISVKLEIVNHDFRSVKASKTATHDSIGKYLLSERYIEKDDSLIVSWRSLLQSKDTLKTIKNIYDYVNRNMVYNGYNPDNVGAVRALKQLKGDCTEFADLFVAFCRSCNIPTKYVYGYAFESSNTPKHSWCEAYCGKYGWVRFDPTTGSLNSFNRLANRYIQLSDLRNDDNLKGHHFYRFTYWGEPVKVTEELNLID